MLKVKYVTVTAYDKHAIISGNKKSKQNRNIFFTDDKLLNFQLLINLAHQNDYVADIELFDMQKK